ILPFAHASLFFLPMLRPPPTSTLFPYTTLFRSNGDHRRPARGGAVRRLGPGLRIRRLPGERGGPGRRAVGQRGASGPAGRQHQRSEEHTSELQSRFDLVCRLLLEKKKKKQQM